MALNNWLQANMTHNALTWEAQQSGLRHAPTWVAVAKIKGVEYGRGSGASQGAAKEAAAYQALAALRAEYGV